MFVIFPCKLFARNKKNAPFYKIWLITDFCFDFTERTTVTLIKPHFVFFSFLNNCFFLISTQYNTFMFVKDLKKMVNATFPHSKFTMLRRRLNV
jgi:hypothetical protein